MSNLVPYLQQNGLDMLEKTYHVYVERHPKYPNLVHLKYNQIETPMGDPIAQECRGIILDESNNWKIIARPFDKFFNYGEPHSHQIDWTTATVQEKLDGSLMYLYFYNGLWHVSSSGKPAADGNVQMSKKLFSDLFWEVWVSMKFGLTLDVLKGMEDYTFMFELMTPQNRVVVPHQTSTMAFLGARNRDSGQEIYPHNFPHLNPVKKFSLASLKDIEETFSTMKPLQQEGYVVVDANFKRVKVKHPGYVAIHHAKDGLKSPRHFVALLMSGEMPEVLTYFPELKQDYDLIKGRWDTLCSSVTEEYEKYKNIPIQKDFALSIKHLRFKDALFQLRCNRYSTVNDWLKDQFMDTILRYLELKE